jgi:hypothetical protein
MPQAQAGLALLGVSEGECICRLASVQNLTYISGIECRISSKEGVMEPTNSFIKCNLRDPEMFEAFTDDIVGLMAPAQRLDTYMILRAKP